MDTTTSKPKSLNPLGLVLLIYIITIILIITFAPFRFEFSERIVFKWSSHIRDTINNIFLFFPFGFFFHFAWRRVSTHVIFWRVALFAFLFSGFIEVSQAFLIGRISSVMDVLYNAGGAILGAFVFSLIKNRLREESVGLFTLELPLIHLVYLLIPLLWLNGLASGDDVSHVWLIIILGSIGAIVLATIYRNHHHFASRLSPVSLSLSAMIWFFLASVPAFFQSQLIVLIFGLFVGFLVFLMSERRTRAAQERRFEILTLKRVLPLFFLYLFLIVFWPLKMPEFSLKWTMGIESLGSVPSASSIFFLLEFIAAITLLGYMLAELSGRWAEKSKKMRCGYTF